MFAPKELFPDKGITLIQYKLKEENSETYKICWLDKSVRIGSRITLKGENTWYKVIERYNEINSQILDMNRNIKWYSLEKNK